MTDLRPLPDAREEIGFRGRYDAGEMELIRGGTRPANSQDEKWTIEWDEPYLRFHHSHRYCIYELRFEEAGTGARVVESWVNRDPGQHQEWEEGHDRAVLEWIIADKLLQLPVCFPVRTDGEGAPGPSLLGRVRGLLAGRGPGDRELYRMHRWLWRCEADVQTRSISGALDVTPSGVVELSAAGWTGPGAVGDAVAGALDVPAPLESWDSIEDAVREATVPGTLFVLRDAGPGSRREALRFATRLWGLTEDRGARDVVVLAGWAPGVVDIEWENAMTDTLRIPDLFGGPVPPLRSSVSLRPEPAARPAEVPKSPARDAPEPWSRRPEDDGRPLRERWIVRDPSGLEDGSHTWDAGGGILERKGDGVEVSVWRAHAWRDRWPSPPETELEGYPARPHRPDGWPEEIPFLPGLVCWISRPEGGDPALVSWLAPPATPPRIAEGSPAPGFGDGFEEIVRWHRDRGWAVRPTPSREGGPTGRTSADLLRGDLRRRLERVGRKGDEELVLLVW